MTSAEQDMMASFRQDYLDLLDSRLAKIAALVAARQLEPAQVALLSLESTSAMVGAQALVAGVRQLRTALERGADAEVDALTGQLSGHAQTARDQLTRRDH